MIMGAVVDDVQLLRMELEKKECELQEQSELSQRLWDEKCSLEKKMESQERDCEYWKEQLESQKQQHSRRTADLERMAEEQLLQLEGELRSREEDLDAARTQRNKEKNDAEELRIEKEHVCSALQRVTMERDQQARLCSDYEQRLAHTKEERDRLYQKLVTMSSELEDERRHTESLEEQISTLSLMCKKLSEDLEQKEDFQQRYEEEMIEYQSMLQRLRESESTVDQLRLHLNQSQPMTPTCSTPGLSLYSEFSPLSNISASSFLRLHSEEEKAECQVSPTSPVIGGPIVGEEVEMEGRKNRLVTRPITVWGEDENGTCCRCSDLEVKLVQSQKQIEHVQQELKQAWLEQEEQHTHCQPLKKSESSQTQLTTVTEGTEDDQQDKERSPSPAQQMEQLHHYINEYNECQKKLQAKSEELSQCRKELDAVSSQLQRAAEQKYHLSEELRAWQDDMEWMIQKKLQEEVKQAKLTGPVNRICRPSNK